MTRRLAPLSCLLALTTTGVAHAAVASPIPASLLESHYHLGQSVGSPTDGHLIGGSRLDEAPYLRFLPAYAGEGARWGLGTLVALINRAARAVSRQFPGAVLSVGHLSRAGGGDIDRHASHESGRDADLSFYIKNQAGRPLYSDHMVSFRGDGTAPSWPGALFDDARNWALVQSIVEEPYARVTYIFVATPLRARLLEYAAHIGAPVAVRNKAAELMVQPRGSLPHDDHFHVRIACPVGMTACVELPRPRASTAVARRAHKPGSTVVASVKAGRGKQPHPHAPPPPASPPETKAPAAPPNPDPPASTAAALVAPFDDVDGPVAPGAATLPGAAPTPRGGQPPEASPGAGHLDIQ